jgi:hypothetical protein
VGAVVISGIYSNPVGKRIKHNSQLCKALLITEFLQGWLLCVWNNGDGAAPITFVKLGGDSVSLRPRQIEVHCTSNEKAYPIMAG